MTSPESFSPAHASNAILNRAFAERVDVSPMQLQRLLFFVACEYAKAALAPLLHESFQPWPYGPVLRSIHDKFRPYAGIPIRAYARDAAGNGRMPAEGTNPIFASAVNTVWRHAKDMSAVDLSRITHLPGSAWSRAFRSEERWVSEKAMADDVTYMAPLGMI